MSMLVAVAPLLSVPITLPPVGLFDMDDGTPAPVVDVPCGTKYTFADAQLLPVVWPIVATTLPEVCEYTTPEHWYPDCGRHVVVSGEPPRIPNENSATITTAIIRMAHPYVIKYSIALCNFILFIEDPFAT